MDIILIAVAAVLCCLAPLIIVGLMRGKSEDSTPEQREKKQ